MAHHDPRSAVKLEIDTTRSAQDLYDDLVGRFAPGLRIWTGETWALVGGPMQPAPHPEDQGRGAVMSTRSKR